MKKVSVFIGICFLSIILYGYTAFAGAEKYTGKDIYKTQVNNNGIEWTLYNDGYLYVEGVGEIGDYDEEYDSDTYGWSQYKDKIKKVEISEGITGVGTWAFANCENLTEIKLPNSLKKLYPFAFLWCDIENVELPDGLEYLGQGAFSCSNRIEEVVIPSSVSFFDNAFSMCEGLKKVYIKARSNGGFTHGYGMFSGCESLESIDVEEGHVAFKSIDGVLYDNTAQVLLQYPGGKDKNINIPSHVKIVVRYAFESDNIEKVIFNEGLQEIHEFAFFNCGNLKEVNIPSSVEFMHDEFIYSYHKLEKLVNKSNVAIDLNKFNDMLWINSKGECVTKLQNDTAYSHHEIASIILKDYSELKLGEERNVLDSFGYKMDEYWYETSKKISDLVFKSSNSNVIRIDALGNIKAVGFGEATIKVSSRYYNPNISDSYVSKSIKINVKPDNLSAPTVISTSLYGHDDVKIAWNRVKGASGYDVYYKSSSMTSYKRMGATSKLFYNKANLEDGKKIVFRVYPYMLINGVKYRSSNYIMSKGIYTLKSVKGVSVKKSSSSKVKISWTDIAGESGYEVYRATSLKGKYIKIASASKKTVIVKATKNKTYYYKVRAYKNVNGKKVYGPWSSAKSYKLK